MNTSVIVDIPTAYRSYRSAFRADPGFREAWQANVACVLMDEAGMEYDQRMAVADKIIKWMFETGEEI